MKAEDIKIIATGSSGNATFITPYKTLLDCGVSKKDLGEEVFKNVSLVLLTHCHSDHFGKRTIKALGSQRPSVRFGCGDFLVPLLLECGIRPQQIDVYEPHKEYRYGDLLLETVTLTHNVPNIGYKLYFERDKQSLIYATDTNNLNGISAKNFDYYLIEANYTVDDIHDRIKKKEMEGAYAYEYAVTHNHLSAEKANDWLAENAGANSMIYYMHEHREKTDAYEHTGQMDTSA